ncbi:hypothetical protein [Demequina silvatica]|uniref:hypothetical protein n=1 Tax=Demequina silvatica TaxID=1638988 RepID=UPI000781F845|nr:hypothetical protein [Demequina silvatica]
MTNRGAWLAAALAAMTLSGCLPAYGASFDYPAAPEVPDGATVVTSAEGRDDDDPIRLIAQVIDPEDQGPDAAREAYREMFPESEGWTAVGPPEGHLLCLLRQEDEDYDEVVEVSPYAGTEPPSAEGRLLVVSSRFPDAVEWAPCDWAERYIPFEIVGP